MISATLRRPASGPAGHGIYGAGWLAVHAPSGTPAPRAGAVQSGRDSARLPRAERILAVTARPGQESADLGALLYALGRDGSSVALLSLTRGEASEFNSTLQPLAAVRPWELQVAAYLIGISSVAVASYPDGSLGSCELADLTERVARAIRRHGADLLLVPDPAGSDQDDAMVAIAACAAADDAGLPAVARTASHAADGWPVDLGDEAGAARAVQRSAMAAHASQSDVLPDVIGRLELLGREEWLRWLTRPRGLQPAPLRAPLADLSRLVPRARALAW